MYSFILLFYLFQIFKEGSHSANAFFQGHSIYYNYIIIRQSFIALETQLHNVKNVKCKKYNIT